jgi:hypothetical protein
MVLLLQAVISEQDFTAAASQLDDWNTARDFLGSIANGCRPEVVFVTEGCVALLATSR